MDFSANGFNGTLVNSPTRVPIGFINSDLSFSGVTDYVNVPHNAALDSYPLTVSTWIKTNASSTSGERGIVNKYVAFSSNGYTIHMNNGNLCAWYFRDASNYVYDNSGCQFNLSGYNDNNWHHIVFVVDGTGGKLYVDNVLKGSQVWTGAAGPATTTQDLHIAHYPRGGGAPEYFIGHIDQTRIYNIAFTTQQVSDTYDADSVDAAYTFYKFDETSGTTASDSTGHGFPGALINGPVWTAGFINNSLLFNGSNNYVNVPHNAALDSYPLTVSTWIKTNASSTSGERGVVNKYVAFSSNGYTIHMNNGNLCAWYFRDASNYVYDNSGCQFNVSGYNDNNWHHIVFVVDGTGGKLYVDNVLKGSQVWTGVAGPATTTQDLHIAHYPRGGGAPEYFIGQMDQTRIHNFALTASQIAVMYDYDVSLGISPPSGLVYTPGTATYTKGTAIANNVPSNSGGAITGYSISRALPSELNLNTTTGVISGTPTVVSPTTSYTVTGSNSGGSTTATFSLTVNDASTPSIIDPTRTVNFGGIVNKWQAGEDPINWLRNVICATIDAAQWGTGLVDAHDTIQAAMDNCPAEQVVMLPAGTYMIGTSLVLNRGITLRGAGANSTKIRLVVNPPQTVAVIYMSNLWPEYCRTPCTDGSVANVTADVPKDSTTIPVDNVSRFSSGDIVQIDQLDDTYVYDGQDARPYFKRPDYGPPPPTTGHRSQGQTVRIDHIVGNVLHLENPSTPMDQIYQSYKLLLQPQVFKPIGPPAISGSGTNQAGMVERAGVENLYVTGGTNDQISMISCAYCWVSHVESDGTTMVPGPGGTQGPGNGMVGAHMVDDRGYHNTIRDSYFHHATDVIQGGGAYGVTLTEHTSNTLVENNIIYYMNKPLTLRASGGGNVIGYNYIDNAWTRADPSLQETTIDMGHSSFPYMDLIEGNWAAQIATEKVWGNSGWMTLFRNYASSQQQRTSVETYQIAAIALESQSRYINVVGNVLGATGAGLVYQVNTGGNPPSGPDQKTVYRIGHGVGAGNGTDDIATYDSPTPGAAESQLYRHGNYDYVTNTVIWDPSNSNHTLPNSLYLPGTPIFFGTNTFPWVNPVGTTKIYILPAKARWDAGTPNG